MSTLATGPAVSLNWATKRSGPVRRDEAAGAAVKGRLFVFGGFHNGTWSATRRADVYNPADNTWTRVRDLPEALTHVATVVQGPRVWLLGGYSGSNPGPAVRSVYVYDTRTNRYARGPSLPDRRGAGAAARVGNTIVYFGGTDRGTSGKASDRGTTWALDLEHVDRGWERRAQLPAGRNHIAAASVGGSVYAIGGQRDYGANADPLALVHRYNPKLDRWTTVASLPEQRSHTLSSTVIYGGSILTIGGESGHNQSRGSIYRYDPATDRWTSFATLPVGRRSPAVAVFGNVLFVTAGSYPGGAQTADTLRATLRGF